MKSLHVIGIIIAMGSISVAIITKDIVCVLLTLAMAMVVVIVGDFPDDRKSNYK